MLQATSDIDEEMAGMDTADDSDEEEDGQPPLKVGIEQHTMYSALLCDILAVSSVAQCGRDTVPHIAASLAPTNMISTLLIVLHTWMLLHYNQFHRMSVCTALNSLL